MLSDNLKRFRKAKGLSQEELALRLNIVRQTISKWEKGLSVPDSEMLIRLAEELGTTVSILLGESVVTEEAPDLKTIAAKLEILNEQFAKQNEKRRKLWRTAFIVIGVVAALSLVQSMIPYIFSLISANEINDAITIIGGADGPTAITVAKASYKNGVQIAAILGIILSIIGIIQTKQK